MNAKFPQINKVGGTFLELLIPLIAILIALTSSPAVADPRPPVRAFDTTAVVHDKAWFDGMYDRGFRLYVLHSTEWGTTQPWWRTQEQVRMALQSGLMVAGYTRQPGDWQAGIEAFGPYADDIRFFVLDIEDTGYTEDEPGQAPTREMVDGICAMGVRPVLYTGKAMWERKMGTSTEFADVPLWDTDVREGITYENQVVSLDSPPPQPYGGWNTTDNRRIGVQQAFDVVIDGVPVDLNTFNLRFLEIDESGC
jgi:hypothetical protein